MPARRKVLDVLKGEAVFPPPLWMMRQAGRYLPEYRQTRKRAGSFLDLCYNPDLAVEVTLQPIERFGFDASILFSDILVVPHALGRDLRFEEGHGPMMTPIAAEEIDRLDTSLFHVNLEPVYETVRRLRRRLPQETTLIGLYTTFMHWGAVLVPPGYTDPVVYASGGNPYGTTAVAGQVTEQVKASVRHQTRRLVEIAAKLAQG